MFYPDRVEGGGEIVATPYWIESATAIKRGQFVLITPGVGVADLADQDQDDPILGVAAEDHNGTTAGRQSGNEILIYDDPNIIFEWVGKHLSTTTSGDATSWIDSSLVAGANDLFNGGIIVIVSTNNIAGFNVGDVLRITDYVSAQGDCTVTGAGGTIASGMTGYVFPGPKIVGHYGFDLDSGHDDLDLDTSGGESIIIREVKEDMINKRMRIFVKLRLHQMGNDAATK
jgi:hypothetical protein